MKATFSFVLLVSSVNMFGQKYESITKKLEDFYSISLTNRSYVRQFYRDYGPQSYKMDSLNKEILKADSLSLSYVVSLVEKHGWLGKDQIGNTANKSIFLTIQHASHDILKKYYPLLEESVRRRQSDKQDLALMEDRILIFEKRPQEYGTQYRYDKNSNVILFPVRDVKNLNKRRRGMKLKSIKKQFGEENVIILSEYP